MPEPTQQPASPSIAPTTSPETSCLPTNFAYSLYCANQTAAGLCPSPYCEMAMVALDAKRTQRGRKHHTFLGASLIQRRALLEHLLTPLELRVEL